MEGDDHVIDDSHPREDDGRLAELRRRHHAVRVKLDGLVARGDRSRADSVALAAETNRLLADATAEGRRALALSQEALTAFEEHTGPMGRRDG
ncbi:MAG TPA: hypothetical protein VN213_05155 [Solirubrobacteraceae bacterium]|nr:hypothetical protein [Solirubrobacteraceae bacterium]